jgi:hypothetical protein
MSDLREYSSRDWLVLFLKAVPALMLVILLILIVPLGLLALGRYFVCRGAAQPRVPPDPAHCGGSWDDRDDCWRSSPRSFSLGGVEGIPCDGSLSCYSLS